MYYRHLSQHQIILQAALREAQGVPIPSGKSGEEPIPYTDAALVTILELKNTSPKRISEFRNIDIPARLSQMAVEEGMTIEKANTIVDGEESFSFTPPAEFNSPLRSRRDCEKLWNHLTKREFIRTAMSRMRHSIKKSDVYASREYPSTLSCFYNAHTSQIAKLSKKGLVDLITEEPTDWFLYKKSQKSKTIEHHNHLVAKSRFSISNIDNQYFKIEDHQHSSGAHEINQTHYDERANGFGFSKSEQLWCFLKEETHDQPRIMCFHSEGTPMEVAPNSDRTKISHFYGHLMENDRLFASGFLQSPIVLVSIEYETLEWYRSKRSGEFNINSQIDLHDLSAKVDPKSPTLIPNFVRNYFVEGC